MYVCMSVRNGLTIEIYGCLRTFWHVPLRKPLRDGMIEVESRTRKIEDDTRMSPDV